MAKKKKAEEKTVKRKASRRRRIQKEPYFIGLDDPAELRKHILEPTREVIQFLQSYEQFKKTKEEKTAAILQLKEELGFIRKEINKLNKLLPKNKVKAEITSRKIKKELIEELPAAVRPRPVAAPPELASLEKELSEIEKKLGKLS